MLGILSKMKTELTSTVQYQLPLSEQLVDLNPLIGQPIKLVYNGHISCIHCHQKTKKSFSQGYCYRCFRSLPQCDLCIMKPEQCHYAEGTCRDPNWGDAFCMQPHFVYLANSSGIKVGITRHTQIPTRWIDQGAVQALPIFKVSSRYLSGLIEVIIAKHVSDKTSWQRMLKSKPEPVDLIAKRDELLATCASELKTLNDQFGDNALAYLTDEKVIDIEFPVVNYPTKVKSLNFDKQAEISGHLEGIKGQYLLLDSGVINIRKFTGYEIELSV
ncbi:MAG: DUF2797 domain-containing protein [Methylococcales bacterium]|nr:DUF2797 domain-containing protein [Methylococcales bacterium]